MLCWIVIGKCVRQRFNHSVWKCQVVQRIALGPCVNIKYHNGGFGCSSFQPNESATADDKWFHKLEVTTKRLISISPFWYQCCNNAIARHCFLFSIENKATELKQTTTISKVVLIDELFSNLPIWYVCYCPSPHPPDTPHPWHPTPLPHPDSKQL